jgi:hypothetical protein
MKDWLFERYLLQLEREGNDDLLLIMEFGAAYYTTEELQQLMVQVNAQKIVANRWHKQLFALGLSVSLWVAGALLAMAYGELLLGYILLGLVPLAVGGALLGHFAIHRRYPTLRETQLVSSIVQQELDRRKKDASIF